MRIKFMTAKEAVALIPDGSCLGTSGFIGLNIPEELEVALEERFLNEGNPKNLTLIYAAGQGDGDSKSLNHLGHEGLLKRVIGGHWNLAPKVQKLAIENKIEAYNLPQGIVSHMFRDLSSGKKGTYSKVGLRTFVDPRVEGGKLNDITKEDIVEKIDILGEEYLFYKAPKLDYVFLKGTYADASGNITLEEEGCVTETMSMAIACKNCGGKVIVQVKDIVEDGTLDPKLVKIASTMVDIIVKTSDVEKYHQQSFGESFNPFYSGQKRAILSDVTPRSLDNRKIIGRRGAFEVKPDSTINLGIGIPETVAEVINEEGSGDKITLTVESGIHGGVPAGGSKFGESMNPALIMDQDKQFDFYDGGGLDITFLGLAQCDEKGNINVSKFGPRIAGCGGFINISQNTKRVVFCGTFTAGGLKEEVVDGKLHIISEGKSKKFIKNVEQITFSADYANETGQEVTYITERAVFELTKDGLLLSEIAPGVDLQKDILDQMDFKPIIPENIKTMDLRIFKDEKMGLTL